MTRYLIHQTVSAQFLRLLRDLESGRNYPAGMDTKIIVVCHSFGTLAFHTYLLNAFPRLVFQHVVFTGCILTRWINWDYFVETLEVLRSAPVNFVRPFDCIARRGYHITNERATSGTRGFSPMGRNVPVNIFKPGGHTAYNPGDFDDIVETIQGNIVSPRIRTEEKFFAALSGAQRVRLRTYRMLGWA